MRKITVNIGREGRVTSSVEKAIGFGGEHNAVALEFKFDEFGLQHFCGAAYYRVVAEGQYSDKLTASNNALSYSLPQSVMLPPSIHCQLVGYTEQNGEAILIAKSEVLELKVDFSEVPYKAVTAEPDVFERTLAACTKLAEESEHNAERATVAADEALLASKNAEDCKEAAKGFAEAAVRSSESAADSAKSVERFASQVGGVANALKGFTSGTDVVLRDVSPLNHDIKVKLSGEGDFGGGLEKGELIGTVDEIWDESIMAHSWQNEDELGSFSVYQNYVPVDNRTDLYVNIPAFSGASAGLLVTDGTVYRTYRVCGYDGGEVYCRIENDAIYISYNGTDVVNYRIEQGSKIIGVSCNGENFDGNELTLYACEMGSGVKLYKGGKNLFDQSLIPNYTLSGVDVQYLPEEDCFLIHGTATSSNQKMCRLAIGIEPNNKYAISTEYISGSVTIPSGGNAVAYFGFNDDPNAVGSEKNNTNLTQTKSSKVFTVTKKYCNYFWIYYTNGVKFDNYKVRIQLEKNSVATDFEPYIEPTECVVNTDGTANVPSLYPTTRLYTDTDGVTIEAEYNRDINKAFAELQQAVAQLSTLAVMTVPENGGDGL